MAQWVNTTASQEGPWFESSLRPFCVELACSSQWPPSSTLASYLGGKTYTGLGVLVIVNSQYVSLMCCELLVLALVTYPRCPSPLSV